MTLQQLRAFVAIVEFGSFRRAARELDVSQAGLTGSLKALEADLGASLLSRSAQGVKLTAEGERLLPRAQLMISEADRARDDLQQARGEPGGTLHVGMGPTPTAILLPLVVPDFHAAFPLVRLRLVSGFHEQLQPALQRGHIELAITALPDSGVGTGLTTRHLFRSKLVVVGRKGHPAAAAPSLRDLQHCEWVLLGSPGGPGSSILRVCAENKLPPPAVAATCESFTQLAALIGATDWLALVPSLLVDQGLLGIQVATIPVREATRGSDNCVIYRSDTPLTQAAAAFAAMCESGARIVTKTPGHPRRLRRSG